eukprot:UN22379
MHSLRLPFSLRHSLHFYFYHFLAFSLLCAVFFPLPPSAAFFDASFPLPPFFTFFFSLFFAFPASFLLSFLSCLLLLLFLDASKKAADGGKGRILHK